MEITLLNYVLQGEVEIEVQLGLNGLWLGRLLDQRHRMWVGIFAAAIACGGGSEPASDATVTDTGLTSTSTTPAWTSSTWSSTFPMDSGSLFPGMETPEHILSIRHAGEWSLSDGAMAGWLRVQEVVDGSVEVHDSAEPVDSGDSGLTTTSPSTPTEPTTGEMEEVRCSVMYTLTGAEPDAHTCAACEFVFDVTHAVTSGNPASCTQEDVPGGEEVRQLGWDPKGWVWWNVSGSGAWVPQYPAQRFDDDVRFSWNVEVGVHVDEEEEE